MVSGSQWPQNSILYVVVLRVYLLVDNNSEKILQNRGKADEPHRGGNVTRATLIAGKASARGEHMLQGLYFSHSPLSPQLGHWLSSERIWESQGHVLEDHSCTMFPLLSFPSRLYYFSQVMHAYDLCEYIYIYHICKQTDANNFCLGRSLMFSI